MAGTHQARRLRIFAGPNGSGKSTIINAIRAYQENGKTIDFGLYINADDIAARLRQNTFSFTDYRISPTPEEFERTAMASGLINEAFDIKRFRACYSTHNKAIALNDPACDEILAQILADFLRKKLLEEEKKFSFETVFSHPSKLDIMRQAKDNGYKVYLYFVSTESPEINVYRVANRVRNGGHHVPEDKIRSRYERSLDLLFEAAQLTHQTFFFDNSAFVTSEHIFQPFAHFKVIDNKKSWSIPNSTNIPGWFEKYYSGKIGE